MIELDVMFYGKKVIDYTTPTGIETRLYSIGYLAEALGRTPATIRKWEISGIIPDSPFRVGGQRKYSAEHIEAIVRCAEKYKLTQGNSIKKSSFPKKVLEEFQRINKEFFDVEEEDGETAE